MRSGGRSIVAKASSVAVVATVAVGASTSKQVRRGASRPTTAGFFFDISLLNF